MEGNPPDKPNKKHNAHLTGGKATKRSKADAKKGIRPKSNNLKAFSFKSANRARVSIARAANLSEKKIHIPVIDRTPVEPPPIVVAIAGPAKVGKSTLLRCLLKHFVKTAVTDLKGPITVVSGKRRRITFLEVSNDINSMIDAAKIADLILLLVDASFGFEMDVFELINICQVHGMPKIMGVLTHMDVIKNETTLRARKKELKHRFWTEVYDGAKLFNLSGIVNEAYLTHEIKNLARFISVMKFRPILWRNSHPYMLIDRVEDVTNPEAVRANDRIDRSVCVYGWLRGAHLKNHSAVHVPGVGDLRIQDVTVLPDPCPIPSTERARKTLRDKDRGVYAPFSGLGGIVYDKDAMYVETGGSAAFQKTKKKDELVTAMEGVRDTIDEKMSKAPLKLLRDMAPVDMDSDGEDEENEDEEESDDEEEEDFKLEDDSDEDELSDEGDAVGHRHGKWQGLTTKALEQYKISNRVKLNWSSIVYGDGSDNASDDEDDGLAGGIFSVPNRAQKKPFKDEEDGFCYRKPISSSKFTTVAALYQNRDWNDDGIRDSIRDCFVTGKWDAEMGMDGDDVDSEAGSDVDSGMDSDDDGLGSDDEDYADLKDVKGDGKTEDKSDNKKPVETDEQAAERRRQAKERLKAQFDAEYDEVRQPYNDLKTELDQQAQRNRSAFEDMDEMTRYQLEGYRPGLYVRIELADVPVEFMDNFDATQPYVMGGLLPGEQNIGFVQVRFKKHRWYNRIMKSRDPLIISCGWRRFQTTVVYSIQDHNMRNRFIKYTPQNMFCQGIFWAPIVAQNTGFLALQSVDEDIPGYRIAATGSVMAMDKSIQVVKKLKLIGHPFEIMKKTAFIQGMFTTSLEVARFEGAALRTVAGIRGFIKKAHPTKEGTFRASFEDQIKRNDIVFLRSWVPVDLPKFYTAVANRLLPPGNKWVGMKTVGRLRYEQGLKAPVNPESHYRPVVAPQREYRGVLIPKPVQRELPFHLKPKHEVGHSRALEEKKLASQPEIVRKHTAVILEPHESKARKLMDMLRIVTDDATTKANEARAARKRKQEKAYSELQERREKKRKETQKKVCRVMSKRDKGRVKSALEILNASSS